MFLPSGDQSSPPASVAIEVNLWTPVTVPAAPSKSAIQTASRFFGREEGKALCHRAPSAGGAVLIGN